MLNVFIDTVWTLVAPLSVPAFAVSQITSELYFVANNTALKGFLRKTGQGLFLERPHKAWQIEQSYFCRVYFLHSFFLFRISTRHMLLSWAHLLTQLITTTSSGSPPRWKMGAGTGRAQGGGSQCACFTFSSSVSVHLQPLLGTNSQLGGRGVGSAGAFGGPLITFWAINRGTHLQGNHYQWVVLSAWWDLAAQVH